MQGMLVGIAHGSNTQKTGDVKMMGLFKEDC